MTDSTSTGILPRIITYNTRSLSFYSINNHRYSSICSFIKDALKDSDILCLQETHLAASERFALSHLNTPVSLNNLNLSSAGTAIIDSPALKNFYTGTDVSLPVSCQGRVQLRRYAPLLPRYLPFQLINVYFFSGPDYSSNYPLLQALRKISNDIPTFLVGDWNFINRPEDSSSPSYNLPPADFADLFNRVLDHFSAIELDHDEHTYYHISDTKTYSWSSRLDRIYIPQTVYRDPVIRPDKLKS